MDKDLRKKVRLLKALQNITYKEVAGYLEITAHSMYAWLHGDYEFCYNTEKRLEDIISLLKE